MIVSWILASALAANVEQSPNARPAELLQAKACRAVGSEASAIPATLQADQLIGLEALPDCLSGIMKNLSATTTRLVGKPDATAVLQVSVGRSFYEAGVMFSAPGDPQIHYTHDTGLLASIIESQWSDYVSPDGDLGQSDFVLIINKGGTKVRLSSAPEPLAGSYEKTLNLEAEFFSGKKPEIASEVDEPHL